MEPENKNDQAESPAENLSQHENNYTERKFWQKLTRFAQKIGIKTVYTALLMFYAYKRKDTPGWAKKIVIGVLGYLISPIDFLPDISPIIGYTDDLGVLGFGLVTIAAFINQEVRSQARTHLAKWFPNFQEEDLKAVEDKL
ncbi:YkvA family protein [Haliscomenobacter sp.]|uniref:YkvA family protein n=1 Tax=Haliscomenobacter sp. TaxID=2717303 RepID=UPI003364E501